LELAAPGKQQRQNREKAAAGYRFLIHASGFRYDWFVPETEAYARHRKQNWLLLREMNPQLLWRFAELNILRLPGFDRAAIEEAESIFSEDANRFRVWIERALLGY
jgi:hypothetical protein